MYISTPGPILWLVISPPLISVHIRGASKPGVEDEDTPECFTPSDTPQKSGVVTETKSFSEPVNGQLPA